MCIDLHLKQKPVPLAYIKGLKKLRIQRVILSLNPAEVTSRDIHHHHNSLPGKYLLYSILFYHIFLLIK